MDASGLHQYFLPRLEEAWDSRSVGSGHIDDDRYVQWAGYELGLQIECVSNRFLEGASRLTDAQIEELRTRGWHDPLGDDLPNHWQVFIDRDDVGSAAAALVDVVQLLRSPSPDVAQARDGRRRGRSVVVVPVGKIGTYDVLSSVLGALGGLADPVVIDLFELSSDELLSLPTAPTATVLEVGEHLTYPLLIDPVPRFVDGPMAHVMSAAGELLGQLEQLRSAGRDVVVVGPRLFPPYEWLYAATLPAAADVVVFVLGEMRDSWLPRRLLHAVLPPLRETPHAAVVRGAVAERGLEVLGDAHIVVETSDPGRDRDTVAVLVHALCNRGSGQLPAALRSQLPRLPRTRAGKHEDDVEMLDAPQEGTHYVGPGKVCDTKACFAELLRAWLDHPDRGTVIGEPSTYGGKPLVRVRVDGRGFHLNGDTREAGVRAYLRLVDEQGPELPWHVVANAAGRINKVALGHPPAPLKYFYLYADEVSSLPFEV